VPNFPGAKALLSKLLSEDIKTKLIVAVGLVGMLLVLISQFVGSGAASAKEKAPQDTTTAQYTTEEYAAQLEEKLQRLISSIQGVGTTQVMVTMEHGVEYVYAQQEKSSTDKKLEPGSEESGERLDYKYNVEYSYVFVDNGYGDKQPLLRTELQPKVQGVVVVCEGADDIRVEQSITNVVTTALHIPTTRVCVVKIDAQSTK